MHQSQFKPIYVSQLPIANPAKPKRIETLVSKTLAAKASNPAADVSEWEREIDALVYELYGLPEDEIKVVEGR